MDRTSKKMMKYLLEQHKHSEIVLFEDFYPEFQEYSKLSQEEIMACVRYLVEEGYIEYSTTKSGYNIGFYLEHKTYRKADFTRQAIISFFAKSVITPIFVSVITTIVTIAIVAPSLEVLPMWIQYLIKALG